MCAGDAMTRNQQGPAVGAECRADAAARGGRFADDSGDIAVGGGAPRFHVERGAEDTEVECGNVREIITEIGEILELAGCDLLTISPSLLEELQKGTGSVPRKLSKESAAQCKLNKISYDEKSFRWAFNENQMATEKLSEGIRTFAADTVKLEKIVTDRLQKS